MSLVRVRKVYTTPPRFWRLWFVTHLGCDPRLADRLWQRFARVATPEQIFLLHQANVPDGAIGPLLDVITPAVLLDLTQMVSPADDGHPRLPEVLRLEETILERTTGSGEWQ